MEETAQQEVTLEEGLAEAIQDLAPTVRMYLMQGKHAMTASRLAGKYRLTPVQADVLERELVLLLLGTQELEEFAQVLAEEGGVPVEMAKTLRDEVENQVVNPLEEQIHQSENPKAEVPGEEAASVPVPTKAEPVAPIVPPVRQAPVPQVPVPSYVAPPLQSPRYVRSESPVAEAMIAPMMPRAGTPRPHITLGAVGTPAPTQAAPRGAEPTPIPVMPVVPTPPVAAPAATPPVGEGAAPASAPATVTEAPASLPSAPATAPTTPNPAPVPHAPPAPASYTADPYREPI